MATVHEVAKLARVSPATVSKYINKSGYVAPETRERVQAAVAQLDYRPNRAARSLKTRNSDQIAVLLPDLTSKLYNTIFISIAAYLQSVGYRAIVFTTNDFPDTETELLRACSYENYAGIILCTCQGENTELFQQLVHRIPVVFLLRMPEYRDVNFIGFEQAETIFRLTDALLRNGTQAITLYTDCETYSSEKDCINGYQTALARNGLPPGVICSYPFTKASSYGIIMRILSGEQRPQVFIASSKTIADAISEVIILNGISLGKEIFVISLGEESWYDSMFFTGVVSTFRPASALGERAAETLIANIASPVVFEKVNLKLKDEFPCERIGQYLELLGQKQSAHGKMGKPTLRILYPDYEYGIDALRCLTSQYCAQFGGEIVVDGMGYEQIYRHMLHKDAAGYDIVAMDLIWLPYFASRGLLLDLTDAPNYDRSVTSGMLSDFFTLASTYRSRIYGYPVSYATELLFYRKDLFGDPGLCEDFYSRYKIPLEPPKDWFTFNLIARYFTREFNPNSPTLYGTTTTTHPYVSAELYNRIWACGGQIFDNHGNVCLYSDAAVRAYTNYAELLSYTSAKHRTSDRLKEMIDGETAMMSTFCSNASALFNRVYSPMASRVDFASIPSRISVASGWVFGVNRFSEHTGECIDFLNWFARDEAAMAFAVLGGSPPQKHLYKFPEIRRSSPWMEMAFNAFSYCRPRLPVIGKDAQPVDPLEIERIVKDPARRYLRDGGCVEEYVRQAHLELCELFERNGIPQNGSPIFL